ncbi:MAG: GerAB/ArcD/ProY family transporter [Kyrpidia tusciae]|nr:GerAB/ArcD/ProY family transporter [Kyrpidia tusciae]MBE3552278.1 GerAB/ArcD/ProY family transporter [Kyrpidia tusciae]
MMHTGYVGSKEARSFLAIVFSASIALTLPQDLALSAGRAGWLSMVIALLVALLACALFSRIAELAPGNSVIAMAGQWWGSAGRWIVGVMLWGYFVLITALVTRAFVEAVIGTILPRTPAHVVMFLFMAVTVYIAYYGIETLSRLSQLVAVVLLWDFYFSWSRTWADGSLLVSRARSRSRHGGGRGVAKSSYFSELVLLGLMFPAFGSSR